MSIFAASDVLQFALRMEENGALFYRKAAELAEDSEIKKLLNFLACEEDEHKKTFEGFLSKVEIYHPTEDYPGEYLNYLHQYIDKKIYFTDNAPKKLDAANALDFAIQTEVDAIVYYTELKGFVDAADAKIVDKIIAEERKHFAQLSALRKKV